MTLSMTIKRLQHILSNYTLFCIANKGTNDKIGDVMILKIPTDAYSNTS